MAELLTLLATWLNFFFNQGKYRIVDSAVGRSQGEAMITLASNDLTWRLLLDRSQVFLNCRQTGVEEASWYPTDLLIRLIDGRRIKSAELTEPLAIWIETHLSEIENSFSPGQLEQTLRELNDLKRRRTQERFG